MFFEVFKIKSAKKNSAHFVSAGGLEPPTLCLKGRCSTPELRALAFLREQI